jgi:cytochrome c biogenesis protein CcmG/thiol:disulfide interchange protein DsbE
MRRGGCSGYDRAMRRVLAPSLIALVSLLPGQPAQALGPGEPAPEIALHDLSGAAVKLAGLRGKVVLVDFWASWCAPCRDELPWLEQLYKKLGKQGLEIVAVNQDEQVDKAAKFLRSHPVTFRVVHDRGGQVAERYAPAKMPSSYLIDGAGRVRYVHLGFRAADGKAIEAEVTRLLAERR